MVAAGVVVASGVVVTAGVVVAAGVVVTYVYLNILLVSVKYYLI